METQIACWGASKWTRVFGWIQIVGNTIALILLILLWISVGAAYSRSSGGNDRTTIAIVVIVNLVVFTVLSIVGLIMAIILLKGTAQKRVSYLTAWIIYNAVSCVIHIISMITSYNDRGIQFLGINECLAIFGIFFVYAHIKDIKRGVFGRV